MKKNVYFGLYAALVAATVLLGEETPEFFLRRINNHLLVNDFPSAIQESREALDLFPHSKPLFEAHIKTLARGSESRESLVAWKKYTASFPFDEAAQNRILEEIAWGTIHKTAASQAPPLRLMGILAAFLSQDARGIPIIMEGLKDPNILIRRATVSLAGHLHDTILKEEVERLVNTEKSWKVRLEAIKAAGVMKLKRTKQPLMAIARDPSCHALERAAAITALVQMQESISRAELSKLVLSNRSGMRILACEIVAHLELREDVDLLMPLLKDHSPDVRAKALHTVGLLRVPINFEKGSVIKLLDDPDTTVAMMAAWVVTLARPAQGQKAMERFFKDPDEGVRRLAAGALVAAGACGFPLSEQVFNASQDPYVRLNLALGLIGQRIMTEAAADVIFLSLATLQEQWMENDATYFTHITPSTVKHDDLIPNAPEAINQKTRLELLNILAVVRHPRAQEAIKKFLQEKKWGITGMASTVFLTEGDEQALELVQDLTNDSEASLRLQAALILAVWGRGEDALAVLEAAYADANFEDKEKILEAVGRVGSKKSLPFLVERLDEAHQSLRLIAAAGLIQILYN